MATNVATLAIKIVSDARDAARGLDDTAGAAGKFQSGMRKAGAVAAVAGVGLLAFGKSAFDAASSAQQSAGAVDAVFGKSAKAIHKFAESSADDTGLASSEYEDMAATFGAQLKNMGFDTDKLAPKTDDLIGLGSDLAAQFGGSTADAVAALSSLMRGETDPIEKYGVSIKEADKEAWKAAHGLDNLTGKADKQADTQATLALLTEQTADATGAFRREQNTAAGQQQRASAAYKDATAALGTALLPIIAAAAKIVAKLSKFVKENADIFQVLAVALGVAVAAIWAVNIAMSANPATLITLAIVALIAGVVVLYKKFQIVRNVLDTIGRVAVLAFKVHFAPLYVLIKGVIKLVRWLGPKLTPVIKSAGRVANTVFKAIVRFVTRVIAVVTRLTKSVARTLVAAFKTARRIAAAVFNAIRPPIKRVIDIAGRLITIVRRVLVAAFRAARDVARAVFDGVRTAIRTTIAVIRTITRVLRDVLEPAFRGVRDVARTIFEAIRTAIRTTIDVIRTISRILRDVLEPAFRGVRDVARAVMTAIRTAIRFVIDKVNALVTVVDDTLGTVFETVGDVAYDAFHVLLDPIQWVIDRINSLIGVIKDVIGFIGQIKMPDLPDLPSWVPIVGGKSAAPAPAPAVAGRGVGTTRTGGAVAPSVVINVNGALDPDAVARQINRLLVARSRRVGGVGRVAGTL